MDPDATLAALREALAAAHQASAGLSNDYEIACWQGVGGLIEALDEWLVKGGALPVEWGRE